MTTKESNPKAGAGDSKVGLSVIPANVLLEVAIALTEGAAKYGSHNYRTEGARASVYYNSTMRHMMSWWEGEDIDPDSGLSHITKAISGLIVLRDCMMRDNCTDDRPPKSIPDLAEFSGLIAAIREKYKDRTPKHHTEKGV